ncbi:tetratricopeptide repeat protein [Natronomonas sp. EA1]|uniref:tetratricopeptide repeat protein n=1 Tax=Natronomonas sp. EA1 TaxID=3421655 RepID=UPI003EBCA5F6
MSRGGTDGRAALAAARAAFIEALVPEPQHKPALVESLGYSRSTVDRAVGRLVEAGFVERTDAGFRATLAGRLAAESFREFEGNARTVLDGVAALGAFPRECGLPMAVLQGSRLETFETPARAFEAMVEPLRTAERYVAVVPTLGDSRLLRLCHARVRTEGMAAELLVAPAVLERLRTEFPRLAADLATAPDVTVRRLAEPSPYGLSLAAGETPTVTLTPAARDATAVITTDEQAAVSWAESVIGDHREAATDVTDEVAALVSALDDTLLGRHETRGPAGLADIGFERLDAAAFSRRTPNDPATGWRVGFELADVYYGHPFERHHDGGSAVAHLRDRLAGGTHTVVTGPPGSGKSTLCRQVACRWVAEELGPVFYRETPARTAFDRPELLTAALESAEGHALVVVEDGAAEGTVPGLVEVLDHARDAPRVTVLTEARESAWPPTPADPRAVALLRETLDTHRLGALTAAECADAVAAFEAATGRSVPPSAETLYGTIRDGDGPGDCHLLGHLLAAYTTPEPWRDATVTGTGLDADVRAAYERVSPDDPDDTLFLEVALLAAVLAAANQPVTPAALHTVAVAHSDETSAHRHVDAAIDTLRGVLLFDRGDGEGFRTHHPFWAVRFLRIALEDRERTAVDAFQRACSALFAAADDPAVEASVAAWFGGPVAGLEPVQSAPDALVEAVFDVLRRDTALAPLFGTTAYAGLTLPDACSAETRLAVRDARLYGWYKAGALDRAAREAEGLLDAVETSGLPAEATGAYTAEARRRLADIADDRGDAATAREHLLAGLDAVSETADRWTETRLLTSLGMVELHVDDYDAAERYLTEAERVGEPLGPCDVRSETLYYLGRLHRKRGDYAEAETYLEETLAVDEACPALPPADEAATLNALGTVAIDRGEPDRAESYYRQALERQREAGNSRGVATTLVNLGDLAMETGDVEAAESCFEEALSVAREADVAVVHGAALGGLGRVATARGAYDEAERYFRERLSVDDSPRTRAVVDRWLGTVAVERGDLETAVERFTAAFEAFAELGAPDRAASAGLLLVEACADAGETRTAREWVRRVRELTREAGLGEYEERVASWDARLAAD